MTIYDKPSIAAGLKDATDSFIAHIAGLDEAGFQVQPDGKWSAGQNLDHLVRSIKPLNTAYGLPVFLLRRLFGTANRPSRTYEALVEKYKARLAAGGRAGAAFVPGIVMFERKSRLMKTYLKRRNRLIRQMARFSEEELDGLILPHPLLGKLTLREMLFFTIHHNHHHLEILQARL